MSGPTAEPVQSAGAADFDALYDAHQRTLHAFLLGRTGDPEMALDLLQELFIRAWRSLALLVALPPTRQRAWLFAVARNLIIDQRRGQTTRQTAQNALVSSVRPTEQIAEGPERIVERDRELQLVDVAIGRLPEALRTVLALQLLGEHTSAEIGELLGRPAGTIRYQLSQARKRLAEELHRLDGLPDSARTQDTTVPALPSPCVSAMRQDRQEVR
jgi:RNA polymerase sigma-70 factor, ECF subfamily